MIFLYLCIVNQEMESESAEPAGIASSAREEYSKLKRKTESLKSDM